MLYTDSFALSVLKFGNALISKSFSCGWWYGVSYYFIALWNWTHPTILSRCIFFACLLHHCHISNNVGHNL